MASTSSLQTLQLKASYSSLEADLAADLQIPLLKHARYYDRGVGFFTSGWLRTVAEGIACFAGRGGLARIVTSPKLERTDWEAIVHGSREQKSQTISKSIALTVEQLKQQLEFRTLDALAWMIRDGLIQFKFALPSGRLEGGDYHPKVAFFRDDHCGWAVHGSMNDSTQAFRNAESVSVFSSHGVGSEYYAAHLSSFNLLWSGEQPNIELFAATDEALEPFLQLTSRVHRPYAAPVVGPAIASRKPRDYQEAAITAWEQNNRRGILEMATGTGKTFTSIYGAGKTFDAVGRLALFVVVPYLHLVDQWAKDLTASGFRPILCKGDVSKWKGPAAEQRLLYESRATAKVCYVATHATASRPEFVKLMGKLRGEKLLIADEVHGLGAGVYRNALSESFDWRLGLSATPKRWYDDAGSRFLEDYLGGSVFEFSLERAIASEYLTPYHYVPITVGLECDEMQEYVRVSRELAIALTRDDEPRVEALVRERTRIVNGCEGVIPEFLRQIKRQMAKAREQDRDLRDTLVYCAPGRHKEVLKAVSDLGLRAHDFVADTPADQRPAILERFAAGDLQVLVAVKCLDEGVDVPSTRVAYLLASSTNPREFVQRRGRILRTSPGKTEAIVYDFLVGYWDKPGEDWLNAARSLARRCLPRFAEFASACLRPFEARQVLLESLRVLNLLSHMDKRPWEVYREMQQEEPLMECEESEGG